MGDTMDKSECEEPCEEATAYEFDAYLHNQMAFGHTTTYDYWKTNQHWFPCHTYLEAALVFLNCWFDNYKKSVQFLF